LQSLKVALISPYRLLLITAAIQAIGGVHQNDFPFVTPNSAPDFTQYFDSLQQITLLSTSSPQTRTTGHWLLSQSDFWTFSSYQNKTITAMSTAEGASPVPAGRQLLR